MSEITNLNVKLQNNPYKDYIIPLIQYFNDVHVRKSNPFEAVSVANILMNRMRNWNLGDSSQPAYRMGIERCCCPELTTSGSDCGWCAKNPATVGTCCKPCAQLEEDQAAAIVSPPNFTVDEFLKLASAEQGLDDPYTPPVRKFEKEIDGMIMTAPNAWVYMQQMVDVFFENVDVIGPFRTELYAGLYLDVIVAIVANFGDFREGFESTGLVVNTRTEGSPAFATTTITTDIYSQLSDYQKYFEIWSTPTNRSIVWFARTDVISPVVPPAVPPIPGITDTYVQIGIDFGAGQNVPEIIAQIIEDRLITVARFSDVSSVGNVVTVKSNEAIVPASDFTNAIMHDNWAYGFVPGSTGSEVTSIDYKNATARGLVGRWFKMYAAADDGVLFYYETPSNPLDPAAFGVPFTSAVAINASAGAGCYQAEGGVTYVCPPKSVCIDGECIYNTDGIEALTTTAITGTGLFDALVIDGCCLRPKDHIEYCGPCSRSYVAIAAGDYPDATGGTSAFGALNQVNEVIAPDGTSFGTVEDDDKYARIWNTSVVAHMKALGRPVDYLKPIAAFPCICCLQNVDCPGGCIIIDCPDFQEDVQRIGSIMMSTPYLAVTAELRFNTPSSRWNGGSGRPVRR